MSSDLQERQTAEDASHDPTTQPPFTTGEVVDNAQWKRDDVTAIARRIRSCDDPFLDDSARHRQSSASACRSFAHFTSIADARQWRCSFPEVGGRR